MKQRIKRYTWLLAANLFISAFTFGGGYTAVPMIRRFFVEKKQYFTEEELMNMAAVAQSAPGAIAVNLSALAGYRAAGIAGAFISCLAAVTPPLIILTVISACYQAFVANAAIAAVLKGMEAGAAALMTDFITDMCALIFRKKQLFLSAMVPLSFMANFLLGIHAAFIIPASCFLCILQVFWKRGTGT